MEKEHIAREAKKAQRKLTSAARKGVGRMQMQTDGKSDKDAGASQNALGEMRDTVRDGTDADRRR